MTEDGGRSNDQKPTESARPDDNDDGDDLQPTEFTPRDPGAGAVDDDDLTPTEFTPAADPDATEFTTSPDLDPTVITTGSGAAATAGAAGEDDKPGTVIRNYTLLEVLGEGGMGVVYKAEQTEPVRRNVALKVIRLGMDTKEVVARFEAERQALAVMDHPGIARVFDAGVTERGRPFFVMEYVQGVPIVDYCDRKDLPTRDRLKLFIDVCQSVQHAHQKGVIHRDLKPSNILVMEAEGGALPKIIDFGIAKATEGTSDEEGMQTTLGQLLGTPEYMSPEQADLFTVDVDTRTDIYALGVVLYELLAGDLPFDGKALRAGGFLKMQKMIKEQAPPRPSTRLTTLGERTTDIAKRRRTEPATLVRQLKGDLDWIVMMALEKDRDRRYQTANAFALDIQRFLDNEPVRARPPSTAYRVKKFVSRNRIGVGAGIAVTLALIGGMIGTAVGFVRATAEATRATAISSFLGDILTSVDPTKAQGREVTVREVLDEAATTVLDKFGDQPDVEASVRATVGTTYNHLGHYDRAEPHLLRTLEIRRRELGTDHPDTLRILNMVAVNYFQQRRLDEAAAIWREVLEVHRRTLGSDHPDTLTTMQNVAAAALAQQEYDEAEPLLEEILAGRTRVLGPDDPSTISTGNNLAELYKQTGRFEKAEPLYIRGLAARRAEQGNKHPRTLISVFNLGSLYNEMGRPDDAEPLVAEARSGFFEVMGEDHPYTLLATRELADVQLQQGRLADAERLAREAYRLHHARYGDDDDETQEVIALLVRLYERRGDSRQAAEWRARLTPAAEPDPAS